MNYKYHIGVGNRQISEFSNYDNAISCLITDLEKEYVLKSDWTNWDDCFDSYEIKFLTDGELEMEHCPYIIRTEGEDC